MISHLQYYRYCGRLICTKPYEVEFSTKCYPYFIDEQTQV